MSNKTSAGQSNRYNLYKTTNRWKTNRQKKIERHLKKYPNDSCALKALDNLSYRRGKPVTRQWSKSAIALAMIFKRFKGAFDKDVFNKNEKIASAALLAPGPYSKTKTTESISEKTMFQLGARLRYVWTS